jgi:ubiquinone/menaquinone biosynthesis C-methylase UbiE
MEKDDKWDNRYITILSDFLDMPKHNMIIDIGCGTGKFTRILQNMGLRNAQIIGIDINRSVLKTARKLSNQKIKYKHGDVFDLDFDSDFADLVTCRTLLMNLKNKGKALKEMIRIAKPNGIVAVVEPDFLSESVFSTIPKETKILKQLVKASAGEVDLQFGPKAASLFHKCGLKNIEVWTYTVSAFIKPPYSDSFPSIHTEDVKGIKNIERLVSTWKKALSEGGMSKRKIEKLLVEAREIDFKRSEQIRNNQYMSVSTIPLFVTKGKKLK